MDIAVLGMGNMGRAIARRLLAGGHRVTVWNRTEGRATELVYAGAREERTVADAVRGAEAAVTMLANDEAVRSVALDQLRPAIGPDTVYVNCSTVSPALSEELAAAFPARFLALPVVGSPAAVDGGTTTLLAGGGRDVLDRVHPMVESLSGSVRLYDTPALALAAKLATNMLLLSEVAALAEAFAVGRGGGLRDDQLRELLGVSPLVGPGLQNRFEDLLTGAHDGWWSTTLGAKDAGLAIDVARATGSDLPVARTVRALYQQAAGAGLEDADIAAVASLYRS
ncbi:NAD(P)-dependent oxidoreductase [Dactylosporangium sp. CA-139066]|uniref:NAD(P)-dependent oxidoreductase n=1 Tax=Dactylosporangium sp. CA-139066 TaxID=3239930 RepID=UPI003D91D591